MNDRELSWEGVRFVLSHQRQVLGQGSTATVSIVQWGGHKAVLKKIETPNSRVFFNETSTLRLLGGAGGAPELIGVSYEPPMLLMSYRGRHTLHDILRDVVLPDGLLLWLGLEVARCLWEVHAVGVIHNDLKDDNVVLVLPRAQMQVPHVSLIDFGLACHQGSSIGLKLRHKTNYYFWVAPEVLGGGVSTQSSDVYSLGMLLEELMLFAWSYEFKKVFGRISRRATVRDAALRPTLKEVMEDLSEGLLTLTFSPPLPSCRRPSPPALPQYCYAHPAHLMPSRGIRQACDRVWGSIVTAFQRFYTLAGKLSSCCRVDRGPSE